MKPARRPATEPYWLYALAGALLIGGPVWHYLFVNRYPFSRPEALILPLGAALLGAAIATAAHRIGGLLEGLSFGVLLFLFVDFQSQGQYRLPTVVVAAACLLLSQLIRARRALITCLTLGAFNLASLPRSGLDSTPASPAAVAPSTAAPPLLLHLVLDEQWGIGGLRAAGDSTTAAFLTDFYRQRGFEVYEGAYSRWSETAPAMSEAFSLRPWSSQEPVLVRGKPNHHYRLRANPYFARLRELGYRIHVYQSSHLDYCHAEAVVVAECRTFPANSIANIGQLRGAWTRRAMLAARYFLNVASHTYVRLKRPPDDPAWGQSLAGRGLATLQLVTRAIAANPGPGTAIFAHVLLPHRPLEVDASCDGYRDPTQRIGFQLAEQQSDSSWRAILGRYAAQDACLHSALADVLAAVDRKVGRDGAILIVHGDHGARMHPQNPRDSAVGRMSPARLNLRFSTLLAIRRPGIPAAVYPEPVPLQDFFWELVKQGFSGEIRSEWRHYVAPDRWDADARTPVRMQSLTVSEMPWAPPVR